MKGQDGLSIPCFWLPHMTWVMPWHMQDIIFESVWNLFFDLMIEMAATYKVNVSLDLRKKKACLRRFNVCGAMVPLCPLPSPVAKTASFVLRFWRKLSWPASLNAWQICRFPWSSWRCHQTRFPNVVEMYAMTSWHSMYFCFKLCFNQAKHDRHFFPVSVLQPFSKTLWRASEPFQNMVYQQVTFFIHHLQTSGGALTRVTTFASILQEVRESNGSSLSLGVLCG